MERDAEDVTVGQSRIDIVHFRNFYTSQIVCESTVLFLYSYTYLLLTTHYFILSFIQKNSQEHSH